MSDYLVLRRDGSIVADAIVFEPSDPLASVMLTGLASLLRQHADNMAFEDMALEQNLDERAEQLTALAAEWGNRDPNAPPADPVKDNAAVAHLIDGTHGDLKHLLVKDLKKP